MKPKVTFIIGTRPEAIKMSPIIKAFKEDIFFDVNVILTGQHKEMASNVMSIFNIKEDINFNIMLKAQSLSHITCKSLEAIRKEFLKNRPNLVLVQGDTSSAFAGALSAFYEKIDIGHIEAGLRTNNLSEPFPEEANRKLISQIATLHFAPTQHSVENLKKEKVLGEIHMTGNSVIDALFYIQKLSGKINIEGIDWENDKVILTTIHRRENWGERLADIAKGLKDLINSHPNIRILMILHKNEKLRKDIKDYLYKCPNIIYKEPLDYPDLVSIIKKCNLILTDSGGLQEEAPSLGKPVLVLRETTERKEAIQAGTAKLVGSSSKKIFNEVSKLITDDNEYKKMSIIKNPFGDGKTSKRILKICKDFYLKRTKNK